MALDSALIWAAGAWACFEELSELVASLLSESTWNCYSRLHRFDVVRAVSDTL